MANSIILPAVLLCSIILTLFFLFHFRGDGIVKQAETEPFTRIFETYVPGYGVISELSTNILGIKSDVFFSIGLLFYIARKSIKTASESIWTLISKYLISTILIESHDDLYPPLMNWIVEQDPTETPRSLRVRTTVTSPWDYWDNVDPSIEFDLSDWEVKVPLRYEPNYGTTYLYWHEGRPIWITLIQQQLSLMEIECKIVLTCLGRSPKPIKCLIQHCRERDYKAQKASTVIRFLLPKKMRMTTDRPPWARPIFRHSRDMDTISLDKDLKSKIEDDVQEFLNPQARRWYYEHGVPYRRGHLYYGPPGTGKTSLSFALAGKFSLQIHCLSLGDPSLMDDDLGHLFQTLHNPSIVLLEDIDATSFTQKRTNVSSSNNEPEERQGVTLSGLLNAIDGVASPEGVLLIMTTNRLGKLDEALIRDGRVDLQVEFALPGKDELRDLFIRTYTRENKMGTELYAKAENFATIVPPSKFSAAEIQGFLIPRKKNPEDALANVTKWAEDKLAAKVKREAEGTTGGWFSRFRQAEWFLRLHQLCFTSTHC